MSPATLPTRRARRLLRGERMATELITGGSSRLVRIGCHHRRLRPPRRQDADCRNLAGAAALGPVTGVSRNRPAGHRDATADRHGYAVVTVRRKPSSPSTGDRTMAARGGTPSAWKEAAVPGALSRTIRVFIIDDHRMFTQAVAAALSEEADMEVVDTVDTVAEARRRLPALETDVILLDQRLPDGQGTHVAAELRALRPGARVVLVTAAAEPSILNEALAAGCAGFVTKSDSIDALAAAVRAAASGATAVSPAMLQRLTSPESQDGPATEALTPRETAVLLFLADGLSNEEISRRLFISIHTLRNHIQNIIGKLGAHSKLEAVSIAIREGLITAPSHEH